MYQINESTRVLNSLFFFTCRCKIELGDVTPHNIKQLKKLNTVVFPVSYNDKFYKDVLEAGELAKLGKQKQKLSFFGIKISTVLLK